MGTSGVREVSDPTSGWLNQYSERAATYKRRLEALYCEKRARRAESRGDLDAAESYYDRARSLRGKLGDREAAVDLGLAHAEVARENGNRGAARKQYERVVELRAREKDAVGALDALEPLLEILDEVGDDDALRQWWGHAMMVLGKAEPGEVSRERREALVDEYAERIHSEDSAGRLYGFALHHFLDGREERGADLLDATWERRDVVREQVGAFRVVLASGVARVAHAELADRDVDREATLDFVADHRERLTDAASTLFEFLREGETEVDPADLRTGVEADDEAELRDVEAEVFGRMLDDLK